MGMWAVKLCSKKILLNWWCQLMQVVLYNVNKMVVIAVVVVVVLVVVVVM